MNYLEHYKKRVTLNGDTSTEASINRSKEDFNRRFKTSPSYYLSSIDGEPIDTIVNTTRDYNIKLVNFRHDYTVRVGSVVNYKGENYLIMEKDKDEIYVKAKMELCNNVFQIETGRERTLVGENEHGAPVFREEVTYRQEPCIVREKFYSTNDNAQLPLPEGHLLIVMQYQEAPNISINSEFTLYGKKYSISDVGYTSVINGEGTMEISAEREVQKNEWK